MAAAGRYHTSARLIAAHHAAQARADARDRRIRDEDLALDGRPRLTGENCERVRTLGRIGR